MKTLAKLSLIVLMFTAVPSFVSAQHQGKGPKSKTKALEEITAVSGTVTEWSNNDDYVYNGFYLKADNVTYYVKFPPHMGKEIRAMGNTLTVNGVVKNSPEGKPEIKMTSIESNGKVKLLSVQNRGRVVGDKNGPVQESLVNATGKIVQLQLNKKGEVCGYILDNDVILRISPHAAGQLSKMVQVGSAIGYTGAEKTLGEGVVQAKKYTIVRCQTISVNGTQYLVR